VNSHKSRVLYTRYANKKESKFFLNKYLKKFNINFNKQEKEKLLNFSKGHLSNIEKIIKNISILNTTLDSNNHF
jgi:hypothetical protein